MNQLFESWPEVLVGYPQLTSIDADADFMLIWDASTKRRKRVLPQNLLSVILGAISLTTAINLTAPASADGIPFDTTIKKTGELTHTPGGADNDEVTLDAAGTIEVSFTVSLEGA